MEDKNISSAEESLAIIESMIYRAKKTVVDNSFLFLLWGWLLFIACITQFMLKVLFNYSHHYYVWAVMYTTLLSLLFPIKKKISRHMATTYIDHTIQYVWIGIISSYILLTLIFLRIGWEHCYTFYIVLMALCCFLTGKLLSFPPLVFGAIISGFLALLTTLLNFDYNILICGLAILVSYIIPGYLLRIRYKKIQPAY